MAVSRTLLVGAGVTVLLAAAAPAAMSASAEAEAVRVPTTFTAWRGVQEFVVLRFASSREASVEYGVTLRCTSTDRPGIKRRPLVSTLNRVSMSGGRLVRIDSLAAGSAQSTTVDVGAVSNGKMRVRVRIMATRRDERCFADTTFQTRRATMPPRAQPEWILTRTVASPV